jgi:hypothetical protein
MDYTAGSSEQMASEVSPTLNNFSTPPANSARARTYPTSGGSLSMNISTGGPHILLFERDQQLVALLNSELQLAGYEIHTARTAVEVFDAIARYPVRLVLVNLAQAAAARREFWVALDTQRRGRGVQVLTFHCTNIADYGPANDEPDERSQNMLADVEVDGMLGIMNMVNAIRSRIAVSTVSNTGTISRLASSPHNPPSIGSQVTIPIPSLHHPSNNQSPTNPIHSPLPGTSPAVPPMSPQAQPPAQSTQSTPPQPVIQPMTPIIPTSSPLSQASPTERSRTSNPNQTDKIRAVIYPNQRTWSSGRDTGGGSGQFSSTSSREQVQQETPWSAHNAQQSSGTIPPTPPTYPTYANATPAAGMHGNGQGQGGQSGQEMRPTNEGTLPKESGLAQLSRMLQEHHAPVVEDIPQESYATSIPPIMPVTPGHSQQEDTALQQRVRPNEAPPISTLAMRASPIQDLPTDRINAGQNDTSSFRRVDEASSTGTSTSSSSPTLISIATAVPPSTPTVPVSPMPPVSPTPLPSASQAAPVPVQAAPPSVQAQERTGTPGSVQGTSTPFDSEPEPLAEELPQDYSSHENEANAHPVQAAQPLNTNANTGNALAEQIQAVVRANSTLHEQTQKTPDNALLLDIVQSLPAMPTPTPQAQQSRPTQVPQVHQGRATRSLGSVLLEGHLVPQNRLEVALNIQHMLRGVDMNYQLGEILLMFKLLTPDQLLAASLVSYGLITPAQISALGRIRQELHAIGLEYDLENLLILFRILTSEQLREVRSSWSG